MTVVTLITTGRAEELALGDFLNKIFPDVEFRSEYTDSFTSARLTGNLDRIPSNAAKLAARLVAAIDPGARMKNAPRADFAIVVEDVELFNADQPERIVQVFLDAVKAHVQDFWPSSAKQTAAFAKLRRQASFHLLSPMLESYFFADRNAVHAIGIEPDAPKLKANHDLESFRTADEDYSEAVEHLKAITNSEKTWIAAEWYESHPKHYFKYLLSPSKPYDPLTVIYKESKHGVAALQRLDTRNLFADSTQLRLLRSFVNDLALALDVNQIAGDNHPLTGGDGNLLRNI